MDKEFILLAENIAAAEQSFLCLFENKETDFTVEALVLAMEISNKKRIFSSNQLRNRVYINAEVVPAYNSNILRALRLNNREDILGLA